MAIRYRIERDREPGAGRGVVVYLVRSRDAPREDDGRLHLRHVSPWFDVALRPKKSSAPMVNMVCEVPRGTRAKYEVTVDELPLHPLRRDVTADGRPRSYPSRMPWNYGMVPRTWEDPAKRTRLPLNAPGFAGSSISAPGDGDPLDVVEVGSGRCAVGGVHAVRALGALALIDGGELDWKIIAIRADDPLVVSGQIRTAADLERALPGTVDRVRRWFVEYKPNSGNRYAYGGRLMEAAAVVKEAHDAWKRMATRGVK